MRRNQGKYAVLILAVLLFMHVAATTEGTADRYINSSEPAFLHDIGPQDQRSDNPLAAAVTAVAVTAVIYRGLRRYNQDTADQDE